MPESVLPENPADYRFHRLRDAFAQAVHPPQDVSRFIRTGCCGAPVYLAERILLMRSRIVRCVGCQIALGDRYDDQESLPKAMLP